MTLAQAITALFYKRLKKRFNFSSIYALSFAIMSIGFTGMFFSQGYPGVVASILVTGIGTGWLFPNANLWIISVVPEERRGRLVGFLTSFTFFGMFCSPLFIQPVQRIVGLQDSFGILVVALLVFAAIHLGFGLRQSTRS
jgi:MFS family permease